MPKCRSCGASITWTRNANNKAVPLNAAGQNHFIDCPGRNQHRAQTPRKPKPPKIEQPSLFPVEPEDAKPEFIPIWKK